MKKIIFGMLAIFFFMLSFFGCQKNVKRAAPQQIHRSEKPKILPVTYVQSNSSTSKSCGCAGHGVTIQTNVEYEIATCRSACKHGLGFRCGTAGYYLCSDGTAVLCPAGHCPPETPPNNGSRTMMASMTFYDDGTMKMIFLNPIPSEEDGNNNFEVEENTLVELAEGTQIGGIAYDSFTGLQGIYTVNRNDGQYGSVIIRVQLNL